MKFATLKHEPALITTVAMQALCCLLRSRQRGRSISAALQRATALSATSCNAFEAAHVSSKITSGSSSHGFHAADSSFTRLSKQLEGFALLKAQMFGPVYPGGACVGNQLSVPLAKLVPLQRWPCRFLSCRQLCITEAVVHQHAQRHCNASRPAGAGLTTWRTTH